LGAGTHNLFKNSIFYVKNPVSYHGHFYYRSGSTIQDLSGGALEHFLLAKRGKKWDGIVATNFSMNDLSENAFSIFSKKAKRRKRIPDEDLNTGNEELLEALKLIDNNQLTRAAALCFGKDGEKVITGAYVKIGFFRTHSDLLYQDVIEGSLIEQVEKTIDLLTTKYMKANIDYEGITRTETYDYPEKALREAVLNAVIHKDYSSNVPVQISVYERWLMIYQRSPARRMDAGNPETKTQLSAGKPRYCPCVFPCRIHRKLGTRYSRHDALLQPGRASRTILQRNGRRFCFGF